MSDTAALVIPFRADGDGVRVRNLHAVVQALLKLELEIIVVEHSSEPCALMSLPATVRRIYIEDHGPFNKAKAVNVGVRMTSAAVVGIHDADFLVRTDALRRSFELSHTEGLVSRPFGPIRDLSREETARFLEQSTFPSIGTSEVISQRVDELMPVCGGIFTVQTRQFWNAGGMDERFMGWGGEDDAMTIALRRTGAVFRIDEDEVAHHLWHPRLLEVRTGHPDYRRNLVLKHWWQISSDETLAEHIAAVRPATPGI
ncbi:MAG: galactosyltransferase-related protein [Microbacteriaceae bacterium]